MDGPTDFIESNVFLEAVEENNAFSLEVMLREMYCSEDLNKQELEELKEACQTLYKAANAILVDIEDGRF